MYRIIIGFLFLFFILPITKGQDIIMDSPEIISEIRKGLGFTYNYQFEEARNALKNVQRSAPSHPATVFLEALIIYWENYPLILDTPNSDLFISLIEKSIRRAEKMIINDPENIEGLFFDLFGRAFYVMHFADNGKQGKVFSHLNKLYRQTVKGFDLQEKFNEFSFTTGLYNYYIVAYPEKNSAYKTISRFFRKGDREYGIKQLKYCSENTLFLRIEAKLFLTLIYLNYENDTEKASLYASELHREFPNNVYYKGLYATILMLNNKFPLADGLILNLENSDDLFSKMQGHILRAYYLEKYERRWHVAFAEYNKGLEMSLKFGDITKYFSAFAYMGIGRYQQRYKMAPEALKNFRTAKNLTSYDYIINDK